MNSPEAWQTTSIALKWNCRTSHDRWKRIGDSVLARGFESLSDLAAGRTLIEAHNNKAHRQTMEACLTEDPGRFWDLVYKYWRARGPHDGLSREKIHLEDFRGELE